MSGSWLRWVGPGSLGTLAGQQYIHKLFWETGHSWPRSNIAVPGAEATAIEYRLMRPLSRSQSPKIVFHLCW